jgi:hypothetical protein
MLARRISVSLYRVKVQVLMYTSAIQVSHAEALRTEVELIK